MHVKVKFLVVILIILTSCVNDKQEDIESIVCEDIFTYTDCVKSIIDTNCISCHNSSAGAIAPFPLETYSQVKDKIKNGNLLTRIQLPDGDASIMPQTGKMPQSKIDVIVAWANGGFVE